jgi:NAD(P)-dependent dehydrogenase (short-subunit alcohol dehydrogenase family)
VRFEGKVAVITGGGSGIGRGCSLRLASEGAQVVIVDRNMESASETAGSITESGGSAIAIEADVTDAAAVERMVEGAVSEFGGIDILFNNAGMELFKDFLETTEEDWDRVLAVNLKSVFLCSRSVVPHMITRGGGAIVNTASVNSFKGAGRLVAYCASKAGVLLVTRSLAIALGPQGIRVNCVCPSLVNTPMTERWLAGVPDRERALTTAKNGHPLKRIGEPSDIAAAVSYLASDDASWVTGASLAVDGGWMA